MAGQLRWADADEIGYQLSEKFPGEDPLAVRFTDLHGRVMKLDDFDDDPAASTEAAASKSVALWVVIICIQRS